MQFHPALSRTAALAAALALMGAAPAAHAAPAATDAVRIYTDYCVALDGDMAAIERKAAAANALLVPDDVMSRYVPVEDGLRGYAVNDPKLRFVIAATPGGGCTLMLFDIPAPELTREFTKSFPLSEPMVDPTQDRITSHYVVKSSSKHAGGIISIGVLKPEAGPNTNVTVSYVSKALREKAERDRPAYEKAMREKQDAPGAPKPR